MYRINWRKWKDAVEAAEVNRKAAPQHERWRYENELTLLYSIRAQGRGKVHRQAAKLTFYQAKALGLKCTEMEGAQRVFTAKHGSIVLYLDADSQAVYVGEAWKDYEREYEFEAAPAKQELALNQA